MEVLNTEKAEIDIKGRYFEYIKDYITSKKDNIEIIAPSVMGIQDALLNSLVAQINKLNTERRNLQFSSNENNPKLTMLNMQLENLRMDILENVNNLIEANKISHEWSRKRIGDLEEEITETTFYRKAAD